DATNTGSDSITVFYSPDTVPPVVEIISPIDGSTVTSPTIPIVGSVNELEIIEVDVNGISFDVFEGGFGDSVNVSVGTNVITIIATDLSGNSGSTSVTVTYDPNQQTGLFDITYPPENTIYQASPGLVTGTLTNPKDLYVNINGKEYLSVNGSLIAYVPLIPGQNTLTLTTHDQSGFEEAQTRLVTLDTSTTDVGGVILNNSFENSLFPQTNWYRWSGNQSFLPTDGSASTLSVTQARTGSQSHAQTLFGQTARWGGTSQEFPVKYGDTVNVSGYLVNFTSDDPMTNVSEAWLEIKFNSNRGNEIDKFLSPKLTSPNDAWELFSVSATAPEGTVSAIFSFVQFGEDGATGTVYYDDAFVEVIDNGLTPPVKNPFDKPVSTGPVQIIGNQLYVNGSPFQIKGVCYQPLPIGFHITQFDVFSAPNIYNRDMPILRDLGANTLRTYGKVTTTAFLDACYNSGVDPVYVVMGFFMNPFDDFTNTAVRDAIKADFSNYVSTFKDHPAVLMWSPGNETESQFNTASDSVYYSLLNELAEIAYNLEGASYHPVTGATENIFDIGDNGLLTSDDDMDYLDAWGGNVYEGITFGDLFDDVRHRTQKLFWVSEFGVDAWNTIDSSGYAGDGSVEEAAQAAWDTGLWDEIAANTDIAAGGTIFEYTDEWWKDDGGTLGTQDFGGHRILDPNINHPDNFVSEEWFGIASVSDDGSGTNVITPRQVFAELKSRWSLPIHDVAVTSLSHPGSINTGDTVTIDVTVSNPGDFDETITVDLDDSTDVVLIGTQSLFVVSGASGLLTFTWDTSGASLGNHDLVAQAQAVPNETNLTNNSTTSPINVQDPGSQPEMHVTNIALQLISRGPNTNARAEITIVDSDNTPIAGAQVATVWSESTTDIDVSLTDTNGRVTFDSDKVRRIQSGSVFTVTVTDVSLSGWNYNASGNQETSDSITTP
ncbi:hypothetical protein IIB34_03610, partial [PVC group bacterium]|nr:hypothetical protein [PVC group bacterium]